MYRVEKLRLFWIMEFFYVNERGVLIRSRSGPSLFFLIPVLVDKGDFTLFYFRVDWTGHGFGGSECYFSEV